MSAFFDALSMSVMSLLMAFAVLTVIMLAMSLSSAIFGRAREDAPKGVQGRPASQIMTGPVTTSQDATQPEQVAAILAALEAAQVDISTGGRVRIEKVSRRGE